jgi:hypothetical protein
MTVEPAEPEGNHEPDSMTTQPGSRGYATGWAHCSFGRAHA